MKTSKLSLALAAIMLASASFLSSCKKHNKDIDEETDSAGDHAMAEHTSNDIISIGSQASDNTSSSLSSYKTGNNEQFLSTGCGTVLRDSTTKTFTVTFNGGNCLDGRTRSGSLIFNYSASTSGAKHYRDPGFSCTVSSDNYVVDGNKVTINNKTIENTTPLGFDPNTTNETWKISASISIAKSDGSTLSWTCDKMKTLLNTSSVYTNSLTPINWANARVGITGIANGTRSGGEIFTAATTSMMIRDFGGCNVGGKHPFIQGTCDLTPSGKETRHIDFGNGTCDNIATVTVKNKTKTITLK